MITIEAIEKLETDLSSKISGVLDLQSLEATRIELLGKKSLVSAHMRSLGSMAAEDRKIMGPALNKLKEEIETRLKQKKVKLEALALDAKIAAEKIDISLPPKPAARGSIHPISQVMEECVTLFAQQGFNLAQGPDIEDDFHNFTALNFPLGHPARYMHDTFFLEEKDDHGLPKCLRTHTSPVQIRAMLDHGAPLRVIAAGRTYRCDSDQTHTPMFHQIEGLAIDTHITMAHLRGCLQQFIEAFFETHAIENRFRPHYFPFTEPSAEMDLRYSIENNQTIIGKGDKWMEILGCGMVHPNVLRAVNIDPDIYQGFAFGLGVDRLAMLKYGIPDLREFFNGDRRWLQHYGFSPYDRPHPAF